MGSDIERIELTDRERLVAKEAAKLAVTELADEFYKQLGKTVMTKILIWLGIAAVAFAYGKGWINPRS